MPLYSHFTDKLVNHKPEVQQAESQVQLPLTGSEPPAAPKVNSTCLQSALESGRSSLPSPTWVKSFAPDSGAFLSRTEACYRLPQPAGPRCVAHGGLCQDEGITTEHLVHRRRLINACS